MYAATKTIVTENRLLLLSSIAALAVLWLVFIPHPMLEQAPTGLLVWWATLSAVTVVNVWVWRLSATAVERRRFFTAPADYLFQRRQLLLSGIYVLGCGFRAIVPRADVQRISLFDHWASSVMVGRSVATVAELCFIVQWALLLNKIARDSGSRFGVFASWLLVPMIVVAEICSWYSVITTSYIGNSIEESLWMLSATLLVVSFYHVRNRCVPAYRPFLAVGMVLGAAYVTFMCMIDVPMYISRWLADEASGRQYFSLGQGLWDVWSRRQVTFAWESWQAELPWMSLYFSVGVWSSLALVHAPQFELKPALVPVYENAR